MRLYEDSGDEVSAREVVASLGLRDEPMTGDAGPRPRVAAAMIASVDGRATVEGRSGGLGHPEDRDLLRELRTGVDCVLAGTGTLIEEKYADLLDDDQKQLRREQGVAEHPVVATIDRHGRLEASDVPIFGEKGVRIAVYSEQPRELTGATADASVVALGEGGVDFPRVLADLHEREGVRAVSCEGGPSLLRQLVAQGCLDELLITVAPMLVAGEGPTSLTGPALDPPAQMRLVAVHRAGEHLFLRYQP